MTQEGRTILKRVVFYDMLSMPGRKDPSSVDSHISIPLDPGMGAVWAPNGYGKTFAFKLLNKMIHPAEYAQSDTGDGSFWLGSFLEGCYHEIMEPSETDTIGALQDSSPTKISSAGVWKADEGQRMVPFTKMLARFVTLGEDGVLSDVKDLWLQPDWSSGGRICRTRLCSYRDLLETHSLPLRGIVNSGSRAWDGSDPASLKPLLLKPWGDIHLGTNEMWIEPMVEAGGDNEGMAIKAKLSTTSIFDFLKDDGDLEIVDLVTRLEIPDLDLRGYREARGMGGSENDPFLPVIPSEYRLFDLFEDNDHPGSSYSPDTVVNWTEVMESVDTRAPRDEFVMTQTNAALDVMRRTHVWYVEVPKSVSDHGLDHSQRLVAGMLEEFTSKRGEGEYDVESILDQLEHDRSSVEGDIEELEAEWDHLKEKIQDKYDENVVYQDDKKTEIEMGIEMVEKERAIGSELAELDLQQEILSRHLQTKSDELINLEKDIEHLQMFGVWWDPSDGYVPAILEEGNSFVSDLLLQINKVLCSDPDNPWSRMAEIHYQPGDSLKRPISFIRPWGGKWNIKEETLSFGQKSAITTECWLAWLENEDIDASNSEEIRRCLILDEPEAGRSEYWVGLLADRIVDASDAIEGVRDKTLMVMSHREELLSNVGWDGHFHVMQPSDVRQAFEDDDWGDGGVGKDEVEMDANLMPGPLEVIEMGLEFPDFVGLGLIPTNVHRGVIDVDAEVLRTETLREYCRMMRLPDHGRKYDLVDRVLTGLNHVFLANTFNLDKKERALLAKISGFDEKEHKGKSSDKRDEALAEHALLSLKKGEIRGYGKPGSEEEE